VHASIDDVGGGFGQKVCVSKEEACVMIAAYHLAQPVKWIEDRWENLVTAGHGRDDAITVALALDDDGRMLGMRAHLVEDVGAYPPSGVGSSAGFVGVMLPGPYRIPRSRCSATAYFSNTGGRVSYRGPWLMESVGREQLLDDVAREIGMDPVELRRRNVVGAADVPYRTATGMVYDDVAIDGCLEEVVRIADYETIRRQQRELRRQGRHVGVGVSLYVEPSGVAAQGSLTTEAVLLRIERSGIVTLMTGGASCGNSIETTFAQIAADRLGCDVDAIAIIQGDTAATPSGSGMGGSRFAPVFGGAVWNASGELRQKVAAVAAHMLEASVEDIEVESGRAYVRGTPGIALDFAAVASRAYDSPRALPEGMSPGLEVMLRFAPANPFTWSAACHLCVCEVDPILGTVDVQRYVVAEDCGVVINPLVVHGQVAGGVVQGIGGVLHEHFAYDDIGNPLTTTFMDYLLPTASDVPFIECHHIETPSFQPGGFRGMGEGGAIGAPPAVANAIADALAPLGVRLTNFPIRPSDIVDAIAAATSAR
jgi:carbon-monoxide dehydrogenase large subunit